MVNIFPGIRSHLENEFLNGGEDERFRGISPNRLQCSGNGLGPAPLVFVAVSIYLLKRRKSALWV